MGGSEKERTATGQKEEITHSSFHSMEWNGYVFKNAFFAFAHSTFQNVEWLYFKTALINS